MIINLMRWFPLGIFLSAVCMPMIMDLNVLPRLIIPMLILIWAMVAVFKYELCVPKLLTWFIAVLFLGQAYLFLSGETYAGNGILLGFVWVACAALLWSLMQSLYVFRAYYYLSFVIAALIWSALGLYVWLGFTDGAALNFFGIALTQDAANKLSGPFVNGNVFGILMVCAWLVSVTFFMQHKDNKAGFYFLSLVFLTLVFTSLARGAWLAWLPVVSLLLFWLFSSKQWLTLGLVTLEVVLAIPIASYLVSTAPTSYELSTQVASVAGGMGQRVVLYPAVLAVWLDHILLGVGFGDLPAHYLTGQAKVMPYMPSSAYGLGATSNAHNHLLHILSEAGILGFLLWATVSFVLFKHLWKGGFNIKNDAWLPLNLALVLWLQGLINVSMFEPLPFFLFFMFLGIGMALQNKENTKAYCITKVVLLPIAGITLMLLGQQAVTLTQNWLLYEKMYWATSGAERGPIIQKLLPYTHTYPRVVQQVALDFEYRHSSPKAWISIQPLIVEALRREEWPILYRALFYTYVQQENWDKACQLGQFIQRHRWPADKANQLAYQGACNGKNTGEFYLEWKGDNDKKMDR